MKEQGKQWLLLALLVPALAWAQEAPQEQVSATSSEVAPVAAPIEPEKRAAIKGLLDAIDADKLVAAIGSGAQNQAKQLVPAILSEALTENKTLNDTQKRALISPLQKDALPKLVEQAGKVFTAPSFKADAIQFQYDAYAKYYTTQEIKELTKFYKSPTGQKFIQVQDQVGRDVVNGLMKKYMSQAVEEVRKASDREVATTKPESAPSKSSSAKSNKSDKK